MIRDTRHATRDTRVCFFKRDTIIKKIMIRDKRHENLFFLCATRDIRKFRLAIKKQIENESLSPSQSKITNYYN